MAEPVTGYCDHCRTDRLFRPISDDDEDSGEVVSWKCHICGRIYLDELPSPRFISPVAKEKKKKNR